MQIYTVNNKKEKQFLHEKTAAFDFSKFTQKEIKELIAAMRTIMKDANGIGLAANQIGINASVFVAQADKKFYAVFNPVIQKYTGEIFELTEGCLSVPGFQGLVKRNEKVMLTGQDYRGKKIKIKAWGLLAHIFQHETDHLNGTLYIDKAERVEKIENSK